MSKKTAPKKTKKPDPKAAGERALKQRKIATEEEALRIRRIVSNMLEPVHERLRAIESRSAPAEAWVPKVGDWVVVTAKSGLFLRGHISKVCRTGPQGGVYLNQPNMADGCCVERKHLRPATPAEIADHKAKEEQRALEAEWAKFDCLQEGDACHLTDEQRAELAILFPNVLVWERFRAVVWYQESLCYIQREIDPCDGENEIPAEHFLRRAKGTIAKRAEEERAKQLAKPLEMGMKVRTKEYGEGFYWFLNDSPSDGFHRIILPKGNVATVLRDQFTIID